MVARIFFRGFLILSLSAIVAMNAHSQEDFTPSDPGSDARTAVFQALTKEQREGVLAQLQQLLSASIDEAKEKIREDGEFRPFAYVGDFEGEGRFVRLSGDQEVPADLALVAIQRMAVNAALDGTLAANLLYVSAKGSGQLTDELKGRFAESLSANDRKLSDVRFLLIEMQHVAGLGILHVVPYWRNGEGWEIGGALQQTIEPRLHQLVKARLEKESGSS